MEMILIDQTRLDVGYRDEVCKNLEQGDILLLSPTPFIPTEEDCTFLREQRQTSGVSHKNIAYKPHLDKITGVNAENTKDSARLHTILSKYSFGAVQTLSELFPRYASAWKVDYASFRPVEEQGRDLPLHHRNDLMHLDAFPTRPTHGGRILRAFTNIHPSRDRIWGIADPFEVIANKYAVDAGLHDVTGFVSVLKRSVERTGRLIGLKLPDRSPYDEFMLRFHHYLKANMEFQRDGEKQQAVFPPGSTWISFTDQVAHKALSGQYALEQTCIIPYQAQLLPDNAPVAVLERLAGRKLVSSQPPLLANDGSKRAHA